MNAADDVRGRIASLREGLPDWLREFPDYALQGRDLVIIGRPGDPDLREPLVRWSRAHGFDLRLEPADWLRGRPRQGSAFPADAAPRGLMLIDSGIVGDVADRDLLRRWSERRRTDLSPHFLPAGWALGVVRLRDVGEPAIAPLAALIEGQLP